MFGKSLKYELRASSRVLVPLLVVMLVLSIVIGSAFAGFGALDRMLGDEPSVEDGVTDDTLTEDTEDTEETEEFGAGDVFAMVIVGAFVLLILAFFVMMVVSSVSVFVLMIRRFYTSFFTDEAYLTFTLPVTVDCHLVTKTVATIIWTMACDVAIILSTGIFMLGMYIFVPDAFAMDEYTKLMLESIFSQFVDIYQGSIVFAVISYIVSSFASYFLLFFSISVGCMLTKKHRFIVCLLCFFVINGVASQLMNIGTTIVMLPFSGQQMTTDNADIVLMATLLISTLISAAEAVGCYFGTRWILKNRVNLD
ncbi:MAG: hypothetical protein IJW21_06125 [Clostridia bacterium]|nr:hypothetical protein [Clostridia bacterium]